MGDSVIVLKRYDNSKVYVVAHVDGIKYCLWEPWTPKTDVHDITANHAWATSFTPSGRYPFTVMTYGGMSNHYLRYDMDTTTAPSVNTQDYATWAFSSSDGAIAAAQRQLYIKYQAYAIRNYYAWFYVNLRVSDGVTAKDTLLISATPASLPEYSTSNDGTVPISISDISGPVKYISIEAIFPIYHRCWFEIDFINFK